MEVNVSNSKSFAYARVSTQEQNVDRQVEEFKALNINERDIFIDKATGSNFNRVMYNSLKYCLRKGDLLYIKSLDRLGRDYKEILKEWEIITQVIGADIVVLDMPLLNTRDRKDLLGNFISNLVLQIFSYFAQQEADSIKKRQAEGILLAKLKGKHLGRPIKVLPENYDEIMKLWVSREMTTKEARDILQIPISTFYDKAKKNGYIR